MELKPPFSKDLMNKTFFYLRKTTSERYDLFLAVPVPKGRRIIQSPEVTYSEDFIALPSYEMARGSDLLTDRIEALVFKDIKPHKSVNGAPLIQVIGLQRIEFGDADLNDTSYDDVAINCPYLHVRGMIHGPDNKVEPAVICPIVDANIDPLLSAAITDRSSNNNYEMTTAIRLQPVAPSPDGVSTVRWEQIESIGSYVLPASQLEGWVEAQVQFTNALEVRKTKVRNKNKTSTGGGGGFGRAIIDGLRKAWDRVVQLFR